MEQNKNLEKYQNWSTDRQSLDKEDLSEIKRARQVVIDSYQDENGNLKIEKKQEVYAQVKDELKLVRDFEPDIVDAIKVYLIIESTIKKYCREIENGVSDNNLISIKKEVVYEFMHQTYGLTPTDYDEIVEFEIDDKCKRRVKNSTKLFFRKAHERISKKFMK